MFFGLFFHVYFLLNSFIELYIVTLYCLIYGLLLIYLFMYLLFIYHPFIYLHFPALFLYYWLTYPPIYPLIRCFLSFLCIYCFINLCIVFSHLFLIYCLLISIFIFSVYLFFISYHGWWMKSTNIMLNMCNFECEWFAISWMFYMLWEIIFNLQDFF